MRFIFFIFLLLVCAVGFAQKTDSAAKKLDSVIKQKSKPKTQTELAASITVVFQGQNQINALLIALDKSDAAHNSIVVPLMDIINKQIDAQLPDSMKKAPGYPLKK